MVSFSFKKNYFASNLEVFILIFFSLWDVNQQISSITYIVWDSGQIPKFKLYFSSNFNAFLFGGWGKNPYPYEIFVSHERKSVISLWKGLLGNTILNLKQFLFKFKSLWAAISFNWLFHWFLVNISLGLKCRWGTIALKKAHKTVVSQLFFS